MTSQRGGNKAGLVEFRPLGTVNEFIDAIRIRVDVFIIEQQCPPGWEPEELDKTATHYIAISANNILATARLREDAPRSLKIERMAVKKEGRGKGFGKRLTDAMVQDALKRHPDRIWMEAQSYATGFYEKAGFRVTSAEYDQWDLGIPHVHMEYSSGQELRG